MSTPQQTSWDVQRQAGPSTGSRTMTLQDVDRSEQNQVVANDDQPTGVLRLRATAGPERRVVWSEGTVDNEGMGKKKSKICCIYHKPKAFDESSDESSASSSDDDGEESDSSSSSSSSSTSSASGVNASSSLREKRASGRQTKVKGKERGQREEEGEKDHDEQCSHGHAHKGRKERRNRGGRTVVLTEPVQTESHSERHDCPRSLPNAYERGFS